MVNRYDKEFDFKIPDKLFVAPLDALGKVLELKQKAYDANEAAMEEIPLIADKIKAIGGHKDIVNNTINSYYQELLDSAEKHGGDYSVLTPKILNIKRRLSRDISPNGRLGKIHNYATNYAEWYKTYKNDKDIDLSLLSATNSAIVKNTYHDLDNHNKLGQFEPDETWFEPIPKSKDAILKGLIDTADKVEFQQSENITQSLNPATGFLETRSQKIKRRDGAPLANTINAAMANNTDLAQGLRLASRLKASGIDTKYNESMGNIGNIVYNATASVLEDEGLTNNAIPKYMQAAYGYSEGDTAMDNQVFIDQRKTQKINTTDSPVFSMFNKPNAWNGKRINGQLVDPNDNSWETRKENMINTQLHHWKGNDPMPGDEPKVFNQFREKLSRAQNETELKAMIKTLDPDVQALYSAAIVGSAITDSKQKIIAEQKVNSAVAKGQVKDKDGNIVSISGDDLKKWKKNGELAVLAVDPKQGGGHVGIALQTPNGPYFIDDDNTNSIQMGNEIFNTHANGKQWYFKNKEGATEQTIIDPYGNSTSTRNW